MVEDVKNYFVVITDYDTNKNRHPESYLAKGTYSEVLKQVHGFIWMAGKGFIYELEAATEQPLGHFKPGMKLRVAGFVVADGSFEEHQKAMFYRLNDMDVQQKLAEMKNLITKTTELYEKTGAYVNASTPPVKGEIETGPENDPKKAV